MLPRLQGRTSCKEDSTCRSEVLVDASLQEKSPNQQGLGVGSLAEGGGQNRNSRSCREQA